MKTKVTVIAAAAILALAAALHIGHEPPAFGKCPLQSALHDDR